MANLTSVLLQLFFSKPTIISDFIIQALTEHVNTFLVTSPTYKSKESCPSVYVLGKNLISELDLNIYIYIYIYIYKCVCVWVCVCVYQNHVTADGRSVSQYVSPLCDLWPDITIWPKVIVRKLLSCPWGTPSVTRGRVYHLSFSVCSNLPVFTSSIFTFHVFHSSAFYVQYIQSFFHSRLGTADYAVFHNIIF
jgi:hypothetical protein